MRMKTIYLAGGCFWGLEKYCQLLPGVTATCVGYANGPTDNPTYAQVCGGSGHAETVRVDYDPGTLGLPRLLALFFDVIDPVSVNRQGNDSGVQYRTGIYYTDGEDSETVACALEALGRRLGKPIAVEAGPLACFFPAEAYHQKYLDKNPGGYCHIAPAKFLKADKP